MKKGPTKKSGERQGGERRRTPRGQSRSVSSKSSTKASAKVTEKDPVSATAPASAVILEQDSCYHCNQSLKGENERALFVEEEVGRVFCSESCIAAYFTPEIERLEKEFFRRLSSSDLSGDERENLAHLRWITLQEPDEVWREKTLSGDYRYTLISEFKPGAKKIWSICICLFLRGEPSFLYLAFPTRNTAMVNHYRRGERVEWAPPQAGQSVETEAGAAGVEEKSDRLADAWTEDETVLAQLNKGRSPDDIPPQDYALYQSCLEETLETPDEVWSHASPGDDPIGLYHFIRHYPDQKPGIWFVIVAREIEGDEEQIEIIDAFPTKDPNLVEHYRQGEQELGQVEPKASARVVH